MKNKLTSILSTAAFFAAAAILPVGICAQAGAFRVISRQAVTGGAKNGQETYFEMGKTAGKPVYKLKNGGIITEALGNIAYAQKADRIVAYGDKAGSHVNNNAYANFYNSNGVLIKSVGKVAGAPFAATLSEDGTLIIAGNKAMPGDPPAMYLFKYDKNGNRVWEHKINNDNPAGLFSAPDNRYIALLSFKAGGIFSHIQYYSSNGALLFVDSSHISVSAIEFIPGNKIVVCTGTEWYLYDAGKSYSLVSSGGLQGKTIGRLPVTAFASGDIFTVVTEAGKGVRIQAFNTKTGSVLAESVFKGQPAYWVPYRAAEIEPNGTIRLQTPAETIILKLNN
ncbi:hypothetical protein [Foetidibacter luteolus]|uniref:hypothetical protein n=1 Tax=Foetidibacter luteolus TaxID=2608880 RepID=UPI00129B897F|nr:hypothetical protein [Foetidibacter luteolus]